MREEQICCFTGHRDLPASAIPEIEYRLARSILDMRARGVICFGAGGARGFDTLAAEAVLELRMTHPELRLVLVLPCPDQTKGWRPREIEAYEYVKARANKVVYTADHYFVGCMQLRDRHLVEGSGHCLCWLTHSKSGTQYTVNYARSRGVEVINLADDSLFSQKG